MNRVIGLFSLLPVVRGDGFAAMQSPTTRAKLREKTNLYLIKKVALDRLRFDIHYSAFVHIFINSFSIGITLRAERYKFSTQQRALQF